MLGELAKANRMVRGIEWVRQNLAGSYLVRIIEIKFRIGPPRKRFLKLSIVDELSGDHVGVTFYEYYNLAKNFKQIFLPLPTRKQLKSRRMKFEIGNF